MNPAPHSHELPPSNIELQAAIANLAGSPTAEASKAFYQKLLGSTLVLLENELEESSVEGDVVKKKSYQKNFRLLKGDGGRVALPAFTDPISLMARYPKGGHLVFVTFSEIAQTLQHSKRTLVINPTGQQPSGTHIPLAAIEALAKGEIPKT